MWTAHKSAAHQQAGIKLWAFCLTQGSSGNIFHTSTKFGIFLKEAITFIRTLFKIIFCLNRPKTKKRMVWKIKFYSLWILISLVRLRNKKFLRPSSSWLPWAPYIRKHVYCVNCSCNSWCHRLINYKDTKAKCRHLKNDLWRDFAAGVYQSL